MAEAALSTQEERLRDLALSGGLGGAIIGLGAGLVSPFRKWSDLAKAAGIGAAGTAGISAGSGYVGDEFLGDPEVDETNPYTKRTGLGGAVVGGGVGALGGAALGSPVGSRLSRLLPENKLTDTIRDYVGRGGLGRMGRLGALGSLGGAATGAWMGMDAGMQTDVIENELRRKVLEDLQRGTT